MINIASILHNDLANGPNLRTVLFVQGCPHHCKGCHNQHTWSFTDGVLYTADKLYTELTSNPLDKGITISGGEPVWQWLDLYPVIEKIHKLGKYHLMLYTGYTVVKLNTMIKLNGDKFLKFLKFFDMVVTEPYIESKRVSPDDHRWYGSYNQKICKIVDNQLVEIQQ